MDHLHEKKVELALMDAKILEAKNVLTSLQEETEAYLATREEEAEKRVAEVLKASESALETASSNLDKVAGMRQGLSNVVSELSKYDEALTTARKDFSAHVKKVVKKLKEKVKDLKAQEMRVKEEQAKIDSEWSQIKVAKKDIQQQTEYVKDQRARLSAAMQEYTQITSE